jgi:RNA polymerase sigma factor (sigma-70 family)
MGLLFENRFSRAVYWEVLSLLLESSYLWDSPVMQHSSILSQIRSWIGRSFIPDSDRELLHRFADSQDQTAFAMLLDRHGPMILATCRRILGDLHLAEDVFQATFLVFARKAKSLRNSDSLPAWLHRVAFRLALQAKQSHRELSIESTSLEPVISTSAIDDLSARELLAILDEELNRLSDSYRSVVILCCLEGYSREEAAKLLNCTPGSIKGRLERGRALLRSQLTNRGLHLPTVLGTSLILAPMISVSASIRSDSLSVLDSHYVIPSRIANIVENMMHTTILGKFQVVCLSITLFCGFGFGLHLLSAPSSKEKDTTSKTSEPITKEETKDQRKDLYGDPLPEGAIMRLGTIQRRIVGAQLAITKDNKSIISIREGKYVRIWDAQTGKLRESRTLPGKSSYLTQISSDCQWLLTENEDSSRLILVNLQTGKKEHQFSLKDARHISSTAFSRDGKRLAINYLVEDTYRIQVWDIATKKELFSKTVSTGNTSHFITFSPDGTEVLAEFGDQNLGILSWNIESGKPRIQAKECHANIPVFTLDGRMMLVNSAPKGENALDLTTGSPVKLDKMPDVEWDWRVHFLPDGRRLLISKPSGIVVWDREKEKELHFLKGAGEDFIVPPDGKTVITNDGSLQRWDLDTGKPLYPDTFEWGHIQEVAAMKFSKNGKFLVSAAKDGSVRLWDTSTGKAIQVWLSHPATRPPRIWTPFDAGVQSLDISDDDNWIVSAGGEDKLLVRNVTTNKSYSIDLPKADQGEFNRRVHHLRIPSDKRQIIAVFGATALDYPVGTSIHHTDKLGVWDLQTGKQLSITAVERDHGDFNIDRRWMIREGKVFDSSTGKELVALEVSGTRAIPPIAFSADGSLIIGGMAKETEKNGQKWYSFSGIRVWETASGKPVAGFPITSLISQVGFLPNHRFAFMRNDEGITFWDLLTGKKIHQQSMLDTYASCVAFSPDGKRMATGHSDSTILIWDIPLPVSSSEKVDAKTLETLWGELEKKEAKNAWQRFWMLADSGEVVLPLLRKRLKPVEIMTKKEIQPLIEALDDSAFASREQAMKQLTELGGRVEVALREALQEKLSIEQEKRIHQILSAITDPASPLSSSMLAEIRAIQLLEQIGTPEAKKFLEELAKGAPSAPVTREAKAALAYLRKVSATD